MTIRRFRVPASVPAVFRRPLQDFIDSVAREVTSLEASLEASLASQTTTVATTPTDPDEIAVVTTRSLVQAESAAQGVNPAQFGGFHWSWGDSAVGGAGEGGIDNPWTVPFDGTLTQMTIGSDVAFIDAATVEVYVNGVGTNESITIAANQGAVAAINVPVSAGDLVALRSTAGTGVNTSGNDVVITIVYEGELEVEGGSGGTGTSGARALAIALRGYLGSGSGGGGGSGSGLPAGGTVGQVLAKQSSADGDAAWEDLVLDGGGA